MGGQNHTYLQSCLLRHLRSQSTIFHSNWDRETTWSKTESGGFNLESHALPQVYDTLLGLKIKELGFKINRANLIRLLHSEQSSCSAVHESCTTLKSNEKCTFVGKG